MKKRFTEEQIIGFLREAFTPPVKMETDSAHGQEADTDINKLSDHRPKKAALTHA